MKQNKAGRQKKKKATENYFKIPDRNFCSIQTEHYYLVKFFT